ncbi:MULTISPECIES: hypothetical protein [Sphingomonas]|uniref:Uncharacterized protein n=1 Tax=Sphingomonas adhaesiva TaxID=28212 RepID=A0A2A4I748_9SPHN|nr:MULTISPECIES: hypothetical protein [Sphingomonas]PCG14305.1 hypothetical protein COA07_11030 [Sphingomonas adhaesiva]
MVFALGCVVIGGVDADISASTRPPLPYTDLATPFRNVATETAGQAETLRIAEIRSRMNGMLPGIYPAGPTYDTRIADALRRFPAVRSDYDRIVAVFPVALHDAIGRFETIYPHFESPLPIYLYHSLGQRDGGSDYLEPGHRHVMLFGADMIAKYHSDDSLEPFLIHEIFHLEHARHFADCDQLWCTIWQEGLAVEATAMMLPNATDHQLLLDIPAPIRGPTDARWAAALCFVAEHFEDTASAATASALLMGGNPPQGLPDRFGYYVGVRLAQATGLSIGRLSRLDNQQARPVARAALVKLIDDARAPCTEAAHPATAARGDRS